MTQGEKQYWDALERVQKNKKPTRANVALEAGKDAAAIKPNRFPELCQAIDASAAKWQDKGKSRDEKNFQKLKARIKELEHQQMEAYNRELMLIAKIRQLELELANRKSNALETLSANMINFEQLGK